MKRYISPKMVVVRIDTQEVIAQTSPENKTLGWSKETVYSTDAFAAPEYRNSLWND